jgi:prophage antirepressor-like protein
MSGIFLFGSHYVFVDPQFARSKMVSLESSVREDAMVSFSFDAGRQTLNLRGQEITTIIFKGQPDLPWFPAKPIILFLGYTNVSQTLDRVHSDDKAPLEELIKQKGEAIGRPALTSSSLNYHDSKTIWINEYGLYKLALGSRKPEAQVFQRWISHEVIPAIRRHGQYIAPVAPIAAHPAVPKQGKKRALEEETTKLVDIVATRTSLTGSELKAFTLMASHKFIELRSREEPQVSTTELNKRYGSSTLGQSTRIPVSQIQMAYAVIDTLRAPGGAMPCHGPPALSRPSSSSSGFSVGTEEHSREKDIANARWISLLATEGPVFYLDAFKGTEGFELRTTEALIRAGRRDLHSANTDEGIVKRMLQLGVHAHHGTWKEMPDGPKYVGVYLDLCNGSASFVIEQIDLAIHCAESGCVLGWTIVERDFNGEDMILRQNRIIDHLISQKWKPASGTISMSTLLHSASKSHRRVLTQFWARQD